MWQNIIIYTIGIAVAGYLGYKIHLMLSSKQANACTDCSGCSGCDLKKEIQKNVQAKKKNNTKR